MPKFVIIGGSYAGLSAVSIVTKSNPSAEITLISPSKHAYFNVASPRLMVSPELLEKTVFPVETIVQENSHGTGTFILGSASTVDPENSIVHYTLVSGESGQLEYDFLVVASGTETKWAGFKTNLDFEHGQREILAASQKLKAAESVAIIGGGATGVETAGEIAYARPGTKVDLYAGAAVLGGVPALSGDASRKLAQLGVNVITGTYVKRVLSDGKEHLVVEKGPDVGIETAYDLIFEAFVTKPYTDFLPASFKDERGYVVTNKALVVDGYANIAAFGDVVSGSGSSIVDLKMRQIGRLTKTAAKWANGGKAPSGLWAWITGLLGDGSDAGRYVGIDHTCLIPISPLGGVGLVFGWVAPNFLVRLAKAKSFMVAGCRDNFGWRT